MRIGITRRPIVVSTNAPSAVLAEILGRVETAQARASLYGIDDPIAAKAFSDTRSVEALFRSAYYRGGIVEGASPSSLPGWSFARASAAAAPDADGHPKAFLSGQPRITTAGLLLESQRANKVTCFNANPTGTTGVTLFDTGAGASLTIVDDVSALAASGLNGLCSTGKVYKLAAGTDDAFAFFEGPVGNTNPHSGSVYVRGAAGRVLIESSPQVAFGTSTTYLRRTTPGITPTLADRRLAVGVAAGATVWFILPQLEQSDFVSSPIITAGSAATRVKDQAQCSASLSGGGWTVFAEFSLPADTNDTAQWAFSVGTNGNNCVEVYRSAGGSLAMRSLIGGAVAWIHTETMAGAKPSVRVAISWNGSAYSSAVNGAAVAGTQSLAGSPTATTLWLGQDPDAANQLNGEIKRVLLVPYPYGLDVLTDMTA